MNIISASRSRFRELENRGVMTPTNSHSLSEIRIEFDVSCKTRIKIATARLPTANCDPEWTNYSEVLTSRLAVIGPTVAIARSR